MYSISKHYVIVSMASSKDHSESDRALEECSESDIDEEKFEVIYVDEGFSSHLWDRMCVSDQVALRMRSSEFCEKTF